MTGPATRGHGSFEDDHAAPDAGRADRHRLVARVASDIGHELKNPIHASVINLELVRKRIADGDRDDAFARLEVVSEQVRRVHGVVEGLLKLLRDGPEPGDVRELDRMVEVVMPVLMAQANSAGVAVEWRPAGPGALCRASTGHLAHTLVGLVALAVAAVRGPGSRGLRLEGATSPCRVCVSAVAADGAGADAAPSDADLVDLVTRIARAGGFAIREDTCEDGVSWSCTVILEADGGA